MKTMTRSQGTAQAEQELTQLAARFQNWRYRRTTPSGPSSSIALGSKPSR